jgi:hypothetical protein
MNRRIDDWMNRRTNLRMNRRIEGCMDGWMYELKDDRGMNRMDTSKVGGMK